MVVEMYEKKVDVLLRKSTWNTRFAGSAFERVCDATLGAILMVSFYFKLFSLK